MPQTSSDLSAWVDAGGDIRRMHVLQRAGSVRTFSDPEGGRALAAIHPQRPGTGTIGDWVGDTRALRAAEEWLVEQGCAEAEGPAFLAPWFPYRATLGPFEQPPMWMEPTEPGERWVEAGYTSSVEYISILAAHDPQVKAAMDVAGGLSSRGWRIETLEQGPSSTITPETFERAARDVYDIATRAFADLPGYLPVAFDVVADYYRPLAAQVDPRFSLIARDPKGTAAGFLIGVPDPLQADRKWFQILSLAVLPEHRSSGVATWMVAAAHRSAARAGLVAGVHALVKVGVGAMDRSWYRGDVIRRYALYTKPLTK